MASMNKVMLIGRLTKDPEMRYTPSGAGVASFSIATNRYSVDESGVKKETADFHNIVVWNQGKRMSADYVAKYLTKGSQVYVEGRLQTRSWEKDGVKRYSTEVVANDVQGLSPNPNGTPTTAKVAEGDNFDEEVVPIPENENE